MLKPTWIDLSLQSMCFHPCIGKADRFLHDFPPKLAGEFDLSLAGGVFCASMIKVSPPILVQASPMAMPGRSALRISSSTKIGCPSSSYNNVSFIVTGSFSSGFSVSMSATFRLILCKDFSKFLTPASRAYSSAIFLRILAG